MSGNTLSFEPKTPLKTKKKKWIVTDFTASFWSRLTGLHVWSEIEDFSLSLPSVLKNGSRSSYLLSGHCNSTWDGFLCWPLTQPGTQASQPCPANVKGILKESKRTSNHVPVCLCFGNKYDTVQGHPYVSSHTKQRITQNKITAHKCWRNIC